MNNGVDMDDDGIIGGLTPDMRIPDALRRELTTMRRVPDRYSVVRMVKCGLGCGKAKAYSLTHADSVNAGTWCAVHGWLFFDSVALPPTEHLRGWELEGQRLTQQRKAAVARRKEHTTIKPSQATTVYDLFSLGWTAHPASLFDEEGVEGWRWEDAEGNERSTVIGNWNEPPPLPDCELPSDRNEESR